MRNKVNSGREAIRERHLKKEKAKLEAEQASQVEKPHQPLLGGTQKLLKPRVARGRRNEL